jgi:hypothetical protein
MRCYILPIALPVLLFSTAASVAQVGNQTVDLLREFDTKKFPVAGEWSSSADGLRVAAGKGSRTILAKSVPRVYQLDVEFTRVSGEDVVAFILPVGETAVALELSSWGGEAHGLARVDEQTSRADTNPTSVRPGKLENGRRYRLSVSVTAEKGNCEVNAQLDGKKLIAWKGLAARLSPHVVFKLPKTSSLGLVSSQNEVLFHKAELRFEAAKLSQPEPSSSPSQPAGRIQLLDLLKPQTLGWLPFNDARFVSTDDGTKEAIASVPGAGSGDRGAFVDGLDFKDGIIEMDLRGDARPQQSFIGVVFNGVDGKTYESVYFRPFNFGSSDLERRAHAVQYISHPEWPWQRLRDERSGQFEKAVTPEPKPADWFHARIEIAGDTVLAFVNRSDNPSLQVKRLTERRSGKVGLWFNGIAAFRNFKVIPAETTP